MVGLDYGRRRIGVAVSDPTRTIASPHSAVSTSGPPDRIPDELLRLLQTVEARLVVVGIPISMDGSEGEMAKEARRFGKALTARTGLPVVEWDERLSSAQAERELQRLDLPRGKRRAKGAADRMAAAMILRGYLSAGAPRPTEDP